MPIDEEEIVNENKRGSTALKPPMGGNISLKRNQNSLSILPKFKIKPSD
jgi:hypothetical protein